MQKNIIVTLIFSVFIAMFALLNAAAVPVNLIFTKVDVSASLVILISASVGAVIVYSLDTVSKMKSRKKFRTLEKNNADLDNENKQLKEKNAKLNYEIERLENLLKESSAEEKTE